MKIAFISSARNIHTIRWANAMSLRGHEVFVLSCAGDMPEDQKFYDDKIRLIELKYQAPLGYYLNARKVKKLVKKEAFDIVNVHYASGYGTLGRMARLKHALLNLWGSDVYLFPYSGRLQLSVIKKNLKYYQYIASTSYCMAEQARKFVKRDDIYITPFGVDTNLFKPISGLKDPDIILFDEPTSALDPELVAGVLDVIKDLAKQHTTMLIVTHEMKFAKNVADEVVFMEGGHIVEMGLAHEVFENPKEERTRQFLSKNNE